MLGGTRGCPTQNLVPPNFQEQKWMQFNDGQTSVCLTQQESAEEEGCHYSNFLELQLNTIYTRHKRVLNYYGRANGKETEIITKMCILARMGTVVYLYHCGREKPTRKLIEKLLENYTQDEDDDYILPSGGAIILVDSLKASEYN